MLAAVGHLVSFLYLFLHLTDAYVTGTCCYSKNAVAQKYVRAKIMFKLSIPYKIFLLLRFVQILEQVFFSKTSVPKMDCEIQ